jgi:hypothetical protein
METEEAILQQPFEGWRLKFSHAFQKYSRFCVLSELQPCGLFFLGGSSLLPAWLNNGHSFLLLKTIQRWLLGFAPIS